MVRALRPVAATVLRRRPSRNSRAGVRAVPGPGPACPGRVQNGADLLMEMQGGKLLVLVRARRQGRGGDAAPGMSPGRGARNRIVLEAARRGLTAGLVLPGRRRRRVPLFLAGLWVGVGGSLVLMLRVFQLPVHDSTRLPGIAVRLAAGGNRGAMSVVFVVLVVPAMLVVPDPVLPNLAKMVGLDVPGPVLGVVVVISDLAMPRPMVGVIVVAASALVVPRPLIVVLVVMAPVLVVPRPALVILVVVMPALVVPRPLVVILVVTALVLVVPRPAVVILVVVVPALVPPRPAVVLAMVAMLGKLVMAVVRARRRRGRRRRGR